MLVDVPFPLNLVPLRARKAILQQFEGRCPNISEVTNISDTHWLKCPGIGPAALTKIQNITFTKGETSDIPSISQFSDVEFAERLRYLLEEFTPIKNVLEARLALRGRQTPDGEVLSWQNRGEISPAITMDECWTC